MDTVYWIIEYGKVFCGYLFLMYIWPSVVFGGHLKDKTRTYRFSFCVTVQVVIVNTVVLMLGLFHVLNRWTVVLLFYGIFMCVCVKKLVFFSFRHPLFGDRKKEIPSATYSAQD